MARHSLIAAIAVLLAATGAGAAEPPPAAQADAWDGAHHPPTAAEEHDREVAIGIAQSPSERARENDAVEQMAHGLLDQEQDNHQGVGPFGNGTSMTH